MDIGTGLPLGVAILGVSLTALKAIPGRKRGGNGKCAYHDQLCKDIRAVRKIVVAMAAQQGITVAEMKDELQEMVE